MKIHDLFKESSHKGSLTESPNTHKWVSSKLIFLGVWNWTKPTRSRLFASAISQGKTLRDLQEAPELTKIDASLGYPLDILREWGVNVAD